MKDGILQIAFGKEYDEYAARCTALSIKYIPVPVCVISNVQKESRSKYWPDSVYFIYLDMPQDMNRHVKTRMVRYTPFERTLYLDCDCIVTKNGLGELFKGKNYIEGDKILLKVHTIKSPGNTRRIYDEHVKLTGARYPLTDFYGGIIGFTRNTKPFFQGWHDNWAKTGSGREMIALGCTVQNQCTRVELLPDNYFAWKPNPHAIIQHEYKNWLKEKIGYLSFQTHKPFDTNKARDWERS